MQQLDMFAEPKPAPLPPDPLIARLVDAGFAHNEYHLSLNRAIQVSFGDLPSRLFNFPIEFVERRRQTDGQSKLWLRHPDFEGFPELDAIEDATGTRPVWQPLDEFGRKRDIGPFWHAIDLLTDEHFQAMLETRNFTDESAVLNGLRFHMDYGGLSIKNARCVLAEFECAEPQDRSAAFLRSDSVRVTEAQQGKFVGMWSRNEQSVWAAIHGLEDGLFKRDRNGFLRFSSAFLAEKEESLSKARAAA